MITKCGSWCLRGNEGSTYWLFTMDKSVSIETIESFMDSYSFNLSKLFNEPSVFEKVKKKK